MAILPHLPKSRKNSDNLPKFNRINRPRPTRDTPYMSHGLKRTYFSLLLPAVAGFVGVFALRQFGIVRWHGLQYPDAVPPLIFIVSVGFAVALPIFYRSLFANRIRRQTFTAERNWLKFERRLLYIAIVAPYVGLIAQILQLPRFHLAGTIVMALYALYYYYPSVRRIEFDRRVFRVKAGND